ncbi:MAG: hypothetical protein P1U87_11565 [Verrucomicrobiales bacterium]|nr:hypothetical protein [Verrucomicrobiales bacterium]
MKFAFPSAMAIAAFACFSCEQGDSAATILVGESEGKAETHSPAIPIGENGSVEDSHRPDTLHGGVHSSSPPSAQVELKD